MGELFSSGRVVDIILTLMLIECAALLAYRYLSGGGIAPALLVPNMLAGAGLLLATKAALVGTGWPWVALWLGISLIAHLYDLHQRWRI